MASTTSLLAILLLEGRQAAAAPVLNIGGSIPFYYEIANTPDAGSDSANPDDAIETYTFTPLTTGAASTTAGYSGTAPYLHAGRSALATLSNGRVSEPVLMSFNRNSSPAGKNPDGNSVFVGTSGLRLLDRSLALPSSASFGYTFSPAHPGQRSAGSDPVPLGDTGAEAAVSPPAANDPADSATPPPGRDSDTIELSAITTAVSAVPPRGAVNPVPARAVTGHPKPANATGPGPARNLAEPVPGATVFDTSAPAPTDASSGAIKAIYQMLQQTAGKAEHGDTRLTAEGYEDSGADATSFTVSSPSDGSVLSREEAVSVPIMVVGTGGGELPSSLTIFTAESAAMEGAGDSLSYFFHHGVAQ